MDTLITIVDANNNVMGSATRKEAQLKGLWHRIVIVHVFNQKGEIYIQKRSPKAETAPNLWDHSAAGHVDENETPEGAAKRELEEELGIEAKDLEFISLYKTERTEGERTFKRYWYLYTYTFDGEMVLQEDEVASGKFVSVEWLVNDTRENPDSYTDGIKKSLQVFLDTNPRHLP